MAMLSRKRATMLSFSRACSRVPHKKLRVSDSQAPRSCSEMVAEAQSATIAGMTSALMTFGTRC